MKGCYGKIVPIGRRDRQHQMTEHKTLVDNKEGYLKELPPEEIEANPSISFGKRANIKLRRNDYQIGEGMAGMGDR
jgi:hypothetical protein